MLSHMMIIIYQKDKNTNERSREKDLPVRIRTVQRACVYEYGHIMRRPFGPLTPDPY